jgi:hypothetical protein
MQSLQTASDKHVARRRSILEQLLRLLLGLWDGFDLWDDDDIVAGMAARSATLVNSAIEQTRRTQRSYLSSVLTSFGVSARDLPEIIDAYPRANTFPSEVYARPVEQFIWKRRNGGTMTESQEAFEQRLRAIAQADMLAAEREEAQRVYSAKSQITGYRRIIHPERSKTGTCGLCLVASSRIYHTNELLPIHDGDECDTAPIVGKADPGKSLNDNDLQEIYNAAGSTAAQDLLNTRVSVNEHGELGPVLVKQGDHFRTPEESGRPAWIPSTPESRRAARDAELASLDRQIASAQFRYDQLVSDDPTTLEPNSPHGDERVALFRAIANMRELAAYVRVQQASE